MRNLTAVEIELSEILITLKSDEPLSGDANKPALERLTAIGEELATYHTFADMQHAYSWVKLIFQHRGVNNPYAALDTAWEGIAGWQA